MSKTRLFVPLALIAVAWSAFGPAARGQDLAMPTTVEQWNQLYDKLESSQPSSLIEGIALMYKNVLTQAAPQIPAPLKAKLAAGQKLSVAEVNQVGKILSQASGGQMDTDELTAESKELPMVQAMLQALGPRVIKASVGPAPGPTTGPGPAAGPTGADPARLWEDFIHYIRIAQFKLAVSNGQALLNANVPAEQLLQVIDQSVYAKNYEKTLLQAQFAQAPDAPELAKQLNAVARQMLDRIDQARKSVIRNAQHIRKAIERLDDGQRANLNATRLLQQSGQFAAPQMLEVLTSRDPQDVQLRPYVVEAMVQVGRPMVLPLCEALANLPRVTQQQVAAILARIGYPMALPYLKALLEKEDLDQATRQALERAYVEIATGRNVPEDATAARLFLQLAEDYYAGKPSLILLPDEPVNLLWQSDEQGRLTSLAIPTPVYRDVMAMRAARRTLELDPGYSQALSLWVMANFRRENNLPQGATDPSYPDTMRSPQFYANLSGPRHLHPVLSRALADRDAELALDAIAALAATTGYQTLLSGSQPTQPILQALSYPDRRVRFEAAFAIAQAGPTEDFPGAGRVVPVLASAVRQADRPVVLALAEDQEAANGLAGRIRSAGQYDVLVGISLEALEPQLRHVPGVSLIAVQAESEKVNQVVQQARADVRLQSAPVLAVTDTEQAVLVDRLFGEDPTVSQVNQAAEESVFAQSVAKALASMAGAQLTAEQATAYAERALQLLREAALTSGSVFDVSLAQPALVEALRDRRLQVAQAAGRVLALLEGAAAQQALAEAALDESLDPTLRTSLLQSLAESAKRFGAQLTDVQNQALLKLVGQARGPLADAAAEAHGALNLPTDSGVQLIIK